VGAIGLHDVPENRLRADLHHGLRPVLGLSRSRVPLPPQRITTGMSCFAGLLIRLPRGFLSAGDSTYKLM